LRLQIYLAKAASAQQTLCPPYFRDLAFAQASRRIGDPVFLDDITWVDISVESSVV
jgi:hypothetical protein